LAPYRFTLLNSTVDHAPKRRRSGGKVAAAATEVTEGSEDEDVTGGEDEEPAIPVKRGRGRPPSKVANTASGSSAETTGTKGRQSAAKKKGKKADLQTATTDDDSDEDLDSQFDDAMKETVDEGTRLVVRDSSAWKSFSVCLKILMNLTILFFFIAIFSIIDDSGSKQARSAQIDEFVKPVGRPKGGRGSLGNAADRRTSADTAAAAAVVDASSSSSSSKNPNAIKKKAVLDDDADAVGEGYTQLKSVKGVPPAHVSYTPAASGQTHSSQYQHNQGASNGSHLSLNWLYWITLLAVHGIKILYVRKHRSPRPSFAGC
jgi:hypothetical protein